MYYEISHLKRNGFNVVEKSPWHFQVIEGKIVINIWPTKRKWMVAYDSGASFYDGPDHLLRIIGEVYARGTEKQAEEWRAHKASWEGGVGTKEQIKASAVPVGSTILTL